MSDVDATGGEAWGLRRVWRLLLPALGVLVLAASASPAGGSGPAIGTITEFTAVGAFSVGDHNRPGREPLVHVLRGHRHVSRRPGTVTAFPYPGWYQWWTDATDSIVAGPDGNLWFTGGCANTTQDTTWGPVNVCKGAIGQHHHRRCDHDVHDPERSAGDDPPRCDHGRPRRGPLVPDVLGEVRSGSLLGQQGLGRQRRLPRKSHDGRRIQPNRPPGRDRFPGDHMDREHRRSCDRRRRRPVRDAELRAPDRRRRPSPPRLAVRRYHAARASRARRRPARHRHGAGRDGARPGRAGLVHRGGQQRRPGRPDRSRRLDHRGGGRSPRAPTASRPARPRTARCGSRTSTTTRSTG